MSMAFARSSYRQAETYGAQEVEDPHQIISVTLRELERSLGVMKAAQDAERKYPEEHMNRAFTAIYILQTSLDFEKGGEIATSLFQVYEFCRLQIVKAFRREENPQIAEALEAIGGILSAWREIGAQVKSGDISNS